MAQSVNETSQWIIDIRRQIARLKSGALLENASISDGQLRLIRAVLLLQGGALLKGEGTFDWTGPGSIAGNWEVLGGGVIRVGGVLISPIGGGRIMIGQGPVGIILDGGAGTLTMGNVRLEGNKIYVGVGENQIVIDGATGVAHIGTSMTLDPSTDGGAALFSNGSKLYSNESAIGVRNGTSSLTVGDELAALLVGGKAFTVADTGFSFTGVEEEDSADGVVWLGLKGNKLVAVSPSVGGPFGNLSWPLPPSTVTDEYGPREAPGDGASTFHEGIDFGAPNGTPIPSAGAGTVEFAGFDTEGGYGNYVLINHGGGLKTRYAHMNATPQVTTGSHVARGQILGEVGNTGTSFGNHLHFEVEYQGVRINPRSKLPAT